MKISLPRDQFISIKRHIYEYNRYKDLLETVQYENTEQWKESWEYFSQKYTESFIAFTLMINSLKEEYNFNGETVYLTLDDNKNEVYLFNTTEEAENKFLELQPKTQSKEFTESISEMYREESKNFFPSRSITLQVTDDCNLRCTYCYQHNKKSHLMDFETAKMLIDKLFNNEIPEYLDTSELIGIVLDFIGGEPLLNIDLVSKISDYFIQQAFLRKSPWAYRFCFSLCSNGLLHFNPKVQEYINRHKNHLSYTITIDGNKELHDKCRLDCNGCGSYDRAIAGVKDYEATQKQKIGSKMTLSPDNIIYTSEALKSILNEGYRHVNLNCVYEEGWTNKHGTILYNELKNIADYLKENELLDKVSFSILTQSSGHPLPEIENQNWCGGTGLMLAMDYKGDLYPCLRYMESSVGDKVEPYIIGNIKKGITQQDKIDKLNEITRRSQSTDECFNCPIASGCGWCSAYNYELYGTPDKRATFICPMHKARTLACKYYFNAKNEKYDFTIPKEWALEIISEDEYNKLLEGSPK